MSDKFRPSKPSAAAAKKASAAAASRAPSKAPSPLAKAPSPAASPAKPPHLTPAKASSPAASKLPPTPAPAVVDHVAQSNTGAAVEEETEETKAASALTERIDMLQMMLDQLKSQDQAKACVVDQKQRLEAEVQALRLQRNSALPAKKQLHKALSRRTAAAKAKDRSTTALNEAEAAVTAAVKALGSAQAAFDAAAAEDDHADLEVVRLQDIVRSEEGRTMRDPVAILVQQMSAAVVGLATSEESKQLFMSALQSMAALHAPVPSAPPMETTLGPGVVTGIDNIVPRTIVAPQQITGVAINVNGLFSHLKAMGAVKEIELQNACTSKVGAPPYMPPSMPPASHGTYLIVGGLGPRTMPLPPPPLAPPRPQSMDGVIEALRPVSKQRASSMCSRLCYHCRCSSLCNRNPCRCNRRRCNFERRQNGMHRISYTIKFLCRRY